MQRFLRAKKVPVAVAGSLLVWVLGGGIAPAQFSLRAHAAQTVVAAYDVAATGDDANPCTEAAPCASLRRATSLARAGDTVLVEAGSYGPQSVSVGLVGTADQPIVVRAQGPVTLTRPLPASDALQLAPLLNYNNATYVVFDGFTLSGMRGRGDYNPRVFAGDPCGYGSGIASCPPPNTPSFDQGTQAEVMGNGSNLTFQNFSVSNTSSGCFKGGSYMTFLNNKARNCAWYPGEPADTFGHGIYVAYDHGVAIGNTIDTCGGYCIHFHGSVSDGTIDHNTLSNAFYAGIIDDMGPSTVTSNILFNNREEGARLGDHVFFAGNLLYGNGHNGGLQFTNEGYDVIANNTFYHDSCGREMGSNSSGTPIGPITVTNNIFDGSGCPSGAIYPGPSGSFYNANLYDNAAPMAGQNASSRQNPNRDHSLMNTDPLFVDAGAANFHLSPLSPAIAAGTPISGLSYGGIAPDLGALCYNCGTSVRPRVARLTHDSSGPRTLYVSSTGSTGTSDCTSAEPCNTLAQASRLAQPGDTISVAPGAYPPQYVGAAGTATAPITITADGQVTLTRPISGSDGLSPALNASLQGEPLLALVNSPDVTVSGFSVVGARGQAGVIAAEAPYTGEIVVETPAGDGGPDTISASSVRDSLTSCINTGSSAARVLSNTVTDCGLTPNTPSYGIAVASAGAIVAGNVVSRTVGDGINATASADDTTTGNVITSNTIADAGWNGTVNEVGRGIYATGASARISGNTIVNSQESGIKVDGADGATVDRNVLILNERQNGQNGQISLRSTTNAKILNNTLYKINPASNGCEISLGYDGSVSQTTIANNIFYGTNNSDCGVGVRSDVSGTHGSSNLFYNMPYVPTGTDAADNTVQGPGTINGSNPWFVDLTASPLPNLALASASPAIAAGTNVGLPYSGAAPDLGALCYSCSPTTPPTMTTTPTMPPTMTTTPTMLPTMTTTPTTTASPTTVASPTASGSTAATATVPAIPSTLSTVPAVATTTPIPTDSPTTTPIPTDSPTTTPIPTDSPTTAAPTMAPSAPPAASTATPRGVSSVAPTATLPVTPTNGTTATSGSTPIAANGSATATAPSKAIATATNQASTTPAPITPTPTQPTPLRQTATPTSRTAPGTSRTSTPTSATTILPRQQRTAVPPRQQRTTARKPSSAHHRMLPTAALPLTVHLSAHHLSDGSTLSIHGHTAPHAQVRIILEVITTHGMAMNGASVHDIGLRGVVSYESAMSATAIHETSDSHGRFSGRILIAYRSARDVRAVLAVVARTAAGSVARTDHVTIRPKSRSLISPRARRVASV